MPIINLTFNASLPNILAGIPQSVSITADIYSTIFYTLDGTDPTILSNIYVGAISLPTNKPTVVLKAYATDGTNNSEIITHSYYHTNHGESIRTSHASVVGVSINKLQSSFPFGSAKNEEAPVFGAVADTLNVVYDSLIPATPHGFDAEGSPTDFTNKELLKIPTKDSLSVQSETDKEGRRGPLIGTLPKITFVKPIEPPEQSTLFSKKFNPKAMVIFQDLTQPQDPNIPQMINGQTIDLQSDSAFDGSKYYNSNMEVPPPRGNFVNMHYNPVDKTLNMYYLDTSCNRWLIVKAPYTYSAPKQTIYNTVFTRRENHPGLQYVYKWVPFQKRYLL